jgi:hypothetical protein
MPAASFQLTSTAVPKRLSDVYLDGPGVVNAAHDIPFRQLIIQASAAVTIGDSAANAATGLPIGVAGSIVLGPFSTGPLKLSEFWVVGAATVSILGIPF